MTDAATLALTAVDIADPAVIVDHVDVTYHLYADEQRRLKSLVGGTRRVHRSIRALKDVSFAAERGQAIGVIGHNGSGKSTMLRAIAGLVPVSAGRVYTLATPVLLGVSAALRPELSGRRNILVGATAIGLSRQQIDERIDGIVEFSGLGNFIDMPLHAYSSGMRARLQFSIATAVTPEILIIDEALATGDADFKERSDARIREVIAAAGTVFLATHVMSSVTDVCNRVLWLDHGELIADGDPEPITVAYREHNERIKQLRDTYGQG
jgi:teichoic acid transport system ATP-binding protein